MLKRGLLVAILCSSGCTTSDPGNDASLADADIDASAPHEDGGADATVSDAAGLDAGALDGGVATRPEWDGTMPSDRVCSVHGWCWVAHRPTSNAMHDVVGFGAADLWVAGGGGSVVRWNGLSWSGIVGIGGTDPGSAIVALHGRSATDLWALHTVAPPRRSASLFHYDGSQWMEVPMPDLGARQPRDLWASPDGDVWMVGTLGWVARRSAGAWTVLDAGTGRDIDAVWGRGSEVWFGGGLISFHWDGVQFGASGAQTIRDIAGDAEALWAASDSGLLRWNETDARWEVARAGNYAAVTAFDGSHVYAAGYEERLGIWYDGATFRNVAAPPCRAPRRAWSLGTEDVVLASLGDREFSACMIARGDASSTSPLTSMLEGTPRRAYPVDRDVLYAIEGGGVLVGDGATWTPAAVPLDSPTAVSGSSRDDVWVVSADGRSAHFDGTAWAASIVSLGERPLPVASDGLEAWTAVDMRVYRWNGSGWTEMYVAAAPVTAVGLAHGEVWIVEGASTWRRATGTAASFVAGPPLPPGSGRVTELSPGPSGSLWALADSGGPLSRLEGGVWTSIALPEGLGATVDAYGDEAWAVTETSSYRLTGGEWIPYVVGTDRLFADSRLDVTRHGQAWITGRINGALRRDL